MWFFVAGGFPMIFVLVFGLVALAAAARFAWRPEAGRLGHIAALCVSVLFASLAGVAAAVLAVSVKVPANPEWANSPDLPLILLVGLGEALTPAVLGFSFVAVVALVTAVGLRRLAPAVA